MNIFKNKFYSTLELFDRLNDDIDSATFRAIFGLVAIILSTGNCSIMFLNWEVSFEHIRWLSYSLFIAFITHYKWEE